MKLKRKTMIEILKALQSVGTLRNFYKFSYAVAKNIQKLNPEIEALSKAELSMYEEYNEEIVNLSKKYADRDENNNPKCDPNGNWIVIDQIAAFMSEKDWTDAKYDIKGKKKEMQAFFDEEIEFNFHMVNENETPQEVNGNELAFLLGYVIDETNSIASKDTKEAKGLKDVPNEK